MTAFSSLNFCLSLAVEFSPDIHTLQSRTSAVGNMIIVSDFLNDLRSNKKHADVPQENFRCLIAWSKPANQLGLVENLSGYVSLSTPAPSISKASGEGCRWEVNFECLQVRRSSNSRNSVGKSSDWNSCGLEGKTVEIQINLGKIYSDQTAGWSPQMVV